MVEQKGAPLDSRVRELLEVAPGELDELGFYATRRLENGQWLALEPMTYGRVRLGISAAITFQTGNSLDDVRTEKALAFAAGYADVWEFDTLEHARAQLEAWSGRGEPKGWRRHPGTSRRRQKDGRVLVRATEIPDSLLHELRQAVARGAGHECEEWRTERAGEDTCRCFLCDKALPLREIVDEEGPVPEFLHGLARTAAVHKFLDETRELSTTDAMAALEDFVARGRRAQNAADAALARGLEDGDKLIAWRTEFETAGLGAPVVAGDHEHKPDADIEFIHNAGGIVIGVELTARGIRRLQEARAHQVEHDPNPTPTRLPGGLKGGSDGDAD